MKVAMAVAVTALALMLQDKENPAFKYWSRWKVGAWVRSRMEVEMIQGQKVETEWTTKLLETGPDRILVERSGTIRKAGQESALPPQRDEITPKDSKFEGADKEGDEEIEVAGKKLKCHWIQIPLELSKTKATTKVWFSDEIPGGVAKFETTGAGGSLPTMRLQAVEWSQR